MIQIDVTNMKNIKFNIEDDHKNNIEIHNKICNLHDCFILSSIYLSNCLIIKLIIGSQINKYADIILKFINVYSIEQDHSQPWDDNGSCVYDNEIYVTSDNYYKYKITLFSGNTIIVKAKSIEYEEIPVDNEAS